MKIDIEKLFSELFIKICDNGRSRARLGVGASARALRFGGIVQEIKKNKP